jgi:hypothetical protein
LLTYSLSAQSKDDVFSKIVKKYKNISSISFSFQNEEITGFYGNLKAKKNNKYIIEANDRIYKMQWQDSLELFNFRKKSYYLGF